MYHFFNFKTPRTSFPSGHTVSAFSVASVYAYSYDSLAVKATAYGLASLVALQRVYADKHWASDVFFGAALGTAVGKMVAAKAGGGEKKVTLLPVYQPGYAGAVAMVKF
jgi:membrane-associated phospholipid phosphatase